MSAPPGRADAAGATLTTSRPERASDEARTESPQTLKGQVLTRAVWTAGPGVTRSSPAGAWARGAGRKPAGGAVRRARACAYLTGLPFGSGVTGFLGRAGVLGLEERIIATENTHEPTKPGAVASIQTGLS